jgi:hypothetical protein
MSATPVIFHRSDDDIVKEEEMMIVVTENPVRKLMNVARRSNGIMAMRSRLVRLSGALIKLIENDGWNAPAIRLALVGMPMTFAGLLLYSMGIGSQDL